MDMQALLYIMYPPPQVKHLMQKKRALQKECTFLSCIFSQNKDPIPRQLARRAAA